MEQEPSPPSDPSSARFWPRSAAFGVHLLWGTDLEAPDLKSIWVECPGIQWQMVTFSTGGVSVRPVLDGVRQKLASAEASHSQCG